MNTIYKQIGGNKFAAMTGAKDFVTDGDKMLQFKVGRGTENKATNCRIELETNDTYTMKFYKIRGVNITQISEIDGLYHDQLAMVFENHTGFVTSL